MEYASWDRIADAVNPILGVITLAAVASVYAIGWLDSRFARWPAAGMDFSTHVGVHVAIVASLWMIDRRLGIAGTLIALLYGALIIYQEYHSLTDIASTAVVIAPLAFGIWILAQRVARR